MKIQPQDLRIGSIVTVNNPKYHPQLKDIPLLITGIYQRAGCVLNLEHINQRTNTYYDTYSQHIEYIEPIPLTEELLLKCGFVKREPTRCTMLLLLDEGYAINDNLAPTLQWWIGRDYVSVCRCGIGATSAKCNSLHQLQNLFYAITGTELEIKL